MAALNPSRIEHLRFAPDILRRIGEELIPGPEQGILELVRNAYDADAHSCVIELNGTDRPGGSILVLDDGDGMSMADIADGWLILGKSRKVGRSRTNLSRAQVGDKGLGRLAALRLGEKATLRTRPRSEPGIEYVVELEWSRFDDVKVVEDVPLTVRQTETAMSHGTTIEIDRVRARLAHREIRRLSRALVLIADPFGAPAGFRPQLKAPGFEQLERIVQEGYFTDAEYHLKAWLDDGGFATASITDWKGEVLWTADHEVLRSYSSRKRRIGSTPGIAGQLHLGGMGSEAPPYNAPAASFELWAFVLKQHDFHVKTSGLSSLRAWLDAVGGVHLYHRGLRVHPYGDPGHDWLDMNLARVRNPEVRPSTNTAIGRVVVDDEDQRLLQKTDRSGFVENDEFHELQKFAQDALEWLADKRLKERDSRLQREREISPKRVEGAHANLEAALAAVPDAIRPTVSHAVSQLKRAHSQEVKAVKEEIEIYRTLGTVGTTISIFAHESTRPLTRIEQLAHGMLERAVRSNEESLLALTKPLEILLRSVGALKTFAAIPLGLLSRSKRKIERVDLHASINDVVDAFTPFARTRLIEIEKDWANASPWARVTVSAIEAIVANLLTNAIAALSSKEARLQQRRIVLRTRVSAGKFFLYVMDNGPGICDIPVEDIWLPGRSTREDGTGLGLTIVRDTVRDLGGTVSLIPNGELGGAEFLVEMPSNEGNT